MKNCQLVDCLKVSFQMRGCFCRTVCGSRVHIQCIRVVGCGSCVCILKFNFFYFDKMNGYVNLCHMGIFFPFHELVLMTVLKEYL